MTVPHDREIPDWFDRIPKVELHCHVEGTVRPTTVIELAAKAGRPLPVDDPAELYRYDSLDSFLAVFWLVQETLVSPEDWARIAYESLVDGAAHGSATLRSRTSTTFCRSRVCKPLGRLC